ncbi:hypothetical protein SAMN02745119_03218 [Trichlorobacter thiogenes]|uniref:Uncharacterized protein n=1 Tax=Trichlorobacter thiogenes TaxID=115783 RepID=A0A1T4S2X0_9BACT|nr:hypothetical protein [Trichlorobacter thiogenes]SKA22660.1 hypothetical protein SAMN02745119_03218 [Trichlorobacter thiogenes]
MRLLNTLLILFVAFFSVASPAISDTSSGVMKDFQFIQNNQRIQPDGSGVLKLARKAFSIRYTGKGLAPSIYASFNPKLKQQFKELHDPIISFAGTGSAASPSQLYVDNEALDFYQGWSAAFETAWGSVQDSKGRAEYVELRNKLASEPIITMSGRNYSNFEPQPDGTFLFTVNRINDSFPPFKDVAPLYLILFADKTSVTPDASSYLLHWSPLTVEFKKK